MHTISDFAVLAGFQIFGAELPNSGTLCLLMILVALNCSLRNDISEFVNLGACSEIPPRFTISDRLHLEIIIADINLASPLSSPFSLSTMRVLVTTNSSYRISVMIIALHKASRNRQLTTHLPTSKRSCCGPGIMYSSSGACLMARV